MKWSTKVINFLRKRKKTENTENLSSSKLPEDMGEETILFQDENIKVFVVKKEHKRQIKFRLEDHLYLLKVEVIKGKMPLLSSIEDVLFKAFKFMIKNLKTFYKPDETNLVYMTINQNGFDGAIRTGAFELQTSQMDSMINHVMNAFNRVANSKATMHLDESFSVYFKVLSMEHVQYSGNRRKRRMVVGCRQFNIKNGNAQYAGKHDFHI